MSIFRCKAVKLCWTWAFQEMALWCAMDKGWSRRYLYRCTSDAPCFQQHPWRGERRLRKHQQQQQISASVANRMGQVGGNEVLKAPAVVNLVGDADHQNAKDLMGSAVALENLEVVPCFHFCRSSIDHPILRTKFTLAPAEANCLWFFNLRGPDDGHWSMANPEPMTASHVEGTKIPMTQSVAFCSFCQPFLVQIQPYRTQTEENCQHQKLQLEWDHQWSHQQACGNGPQCFANGFK